MRLRRTSGIYLEDLHSKKMKNLKWMDRYPDMYDLWMLSQEHTNREWSDGSIIKSLAPVPQDQILYQHPWQLTTVFFFLNNVKLQIKFWKYLRVQAEWLKFIIISCQFYSVEWWCCLSDLLIDIASVNFLWTSND